MYKQVQLFFFLRMFSMPNQDCGLAEMCVSTEYFSIIKSDKPLARPKILNIKSVKNISGAAKQTTKQLVGKYS